MNQKIKRANQTAVETDAEKPKKQRLQSKQFKESSHDEKPDLNKYMSFAPQQQKEVLNFEETSKKPPLEVIHENGRESSDGQ